MMRNLLGAVMGLCVAMLAGCGARERGPGDDGKLKVMCSFFPIQQFTKNVVGTVSGVAVETMLPAQRGCPHDYDLSPDDVKRIARADLFIMNGAGLESFGEEAVRNANPDLTVVDTSKGIEPIKLSGDHAHDHAESEEGHDHSHHHASDVNPHFFSSPRAAIQQVQNIRDALAKADPANADAYKANAAAYIERLTKLADDFESAAKGFAKKEIVTVHEVFDYLARDCGLNVVATIHPVAGSEPSPADMRKTIETIKEKKAAAVFTEPQYSTAVAQTIAREAGVPVEELDPVASGPPDAAMSYYEQRMRTNLATLIRVLGK